MALDAIAEHRVRVKYRSLLNHVIAFEMQATPETLEMEITCANALAEALERIDKLLKSAPDVPRNYVANMLRWIVRSGSEAQKAEARAILALETNHRHREI